MQHGQAIRFVEVRGDLGEPAVRGVADGTRNVIAHGVTEALLDLVREGRGDIAGRHRGGELVNGAHGIDGQHVENRRDDTVVDARIEIGLLGDQCNSRAPSAGVRDGHAGRDPGALGHRVGGDHAAVDSPRERNDPQGPALQPAIGLFFTGGKEAVEINVQLFREGGLPHPRTIANKKRMCKLQERCSMARRGQRRGTCPQARDDPRQRQSVPEPAAPGA